MEAAACAVGRLDPNGSWIGFAPSLDDGYLLVVGSDAGPRSAAAGADELLSLAVAYFEESFDEPPEELATTHGDIAALVRHVAELASDEERRRLLGEAVDAIDDGLAADVVVGRLSRCLDRGVDPVGLLTRRASELAGG